MKHRSATITAGLYWLSVVATYAWAAIAHDETGLAFLPFTSLALPWTLIMYPVAEQISSHSVAAAAYAILCILFSGVNALILYGLIVASSNVIRRAIRN